jgi:hypothetical protein
LSGIAEITLRNENLNEFITTNIPVGDVDALLFRDKVKSVYMSLCTRQGNGINLLATRIALEANILDVPQIDVDTPNLNLYLRQLPQAGILYAMKGKNLINYNINNLKRDWKRLFPENPLYMALMRRYHTPRQALTEFHFSDTSQLVPALQMKLYGKITAYSNECILRAIYGAAIAKSYPDFFNGKNPPMLIAKHVGKRTVMK